MGATEQWGRMLVAWKDRLGTYRAVADAAKVHENTVLRWTQGTAPDQKMEARLSELLSVEPEALATLFDQVRREQFRRRLQWQLQITEPSEPSKPPTRAGGSAAASSPFPHTSPAPPSEEPATGKRLQSYNGRRRQLDGRRVKRAKYAKDKTSSVKLLVSEPQYWRRAA